MPASGRGRQIRTTLGPDGAALMSMRTRSCCQVAGDIANAVSDYIFGPMEVQVPQGVDRLGTGFGGPLSRVQGSVIGVRS